MKFYKKERQFVSFLFGASSKEAQASSAVSSLDTSNLNSLSVSLLIGGVFATNPSNPLNPDGAETPHLDKKLTRPGTILMPRLKNIDGGLLREQPRFKIRNPLVYRDGIELEEDPSLEPYLAFLGVNPKVEALALRVDDDDRSRYRGWADDGDDFALCLSPKLPSLYPLKSIPSEEKPITFVLEPFYPRGIATQEGGADPPNDKRPVLPIQPDNCTEYETGRKAGELWLELLHKEDSSDIAGSATLARDVALFTTAPMLFCSDLMVPEVVFLVHLVGSKFGHHRNIGFVLDVREIALAAGAEVVLIKQDPETMDRWARDQAIFGYWQTPNELRHGVLKCMRTKHLDKDLFASYLPDNLKDVKNAEVGVLDHLYQAWIGKKIADSSQDYGGNVLVSPPVLEATPSIEQDDAGPGVAAHPVAPYGKLILGDQAPAEVSRRPSEAFRTFLHAQMVQPVLSFDAGWLGVGHIDELISFVPAPQVCPSTGVGNRGWAMALACTDLAWLLLWRAVAEESAVKRLWRNPDLALRAEKTLPAFPSLKEARIFIDGYTVKEGSPYEILDRSVHIFQGLLDLAELRLNKGLALSENRLDTIALPVLVQHVARGRHRSVLPNATNLLVLGQTVIVPKPWGPRVTMKRAGTILHAVFKYMEIGAFDAGYLTEALLTETAWVYHDEDLFKAWGEKAIPLVAKRFFVEPKGVQLTEGRSQTETWQHFTIRHDDSVDILEAYIRVRFEALGLTVHFVDDWLTYHKQSGDVHCATNVRRTPPAVSPEDLWWHHFEDYAKVEPPYEIVYVDL